MTDIPEGVTPREVIVDLVRRGKLTSLDVAMACALPVQREMIVSPARAKAAVCGRRAGKTTCADLALIYDAHSHPGALYPYVLLTKSSGRDITWPVLHELEAKFGLGLSFNEQQLRAKLKNGATIAIMGADDRRDMERLRGSKYRKAIIDEAGSFPRELLGYLIDSVITPATADSQGDVWMIGSPNAAAMGYFYDATVGATPTHFGPGQWPTWHWSALDNSYWPTARADIQQIIDRKGWTWDSPVVKREWLGMWVRDESGLVYRLVRARHIKPAPDDLTRFVLGIDLGSSATAATTAFVLLGHRETGRSVWAVSATKESGMSPDSIADRIQSYTSARKIDRIVCDAGGLGGGYIKHFVETRKLPVEPAEKKDKSGTIELLNGELDGGRFMIDPCCSQLIGEIEILPWNEKRTDAALGCHDHCCDAMLYAWRATTAYANEEPVVNTIRGTAEHAAEQEKKWRQRWSKPKQRREYWEPPNSVD